MTSLCIHVRPVRLTSDGLAALRSTLEESPGPDEVLVVSRTTRIRLPLTVDARARGLISAVAAALGGSPTVHVCDPEAAW